VFGQDSNVIESVLIVLLYSGLYPLRVQPGRY
jgi:hypothetical protein